MPVGILIGPVGILIGPVGIMNCSFRDFDCRDFEGYSRWVFYFHNVPLQCIGTDLASYIIVLCHIIQSIQFTSDLQYLKGV